MQFDFEALVSFNTSSSFILGATRDMCFRGMWTRLPHQRCTSSPRTTVCLTHIGLFWQKK